MRHTGRTQGQQGKDFAAQTARAGASGSPSCICGAVSLEVSSMDHTLRELAGSSSASCFVSTWCLRRSRTTRSRSLTMMKGIAPLNIGRAVQGGVRIGGPDTERVYEITCRREVRTRIMFPPPSHSRPMDSTVVPHGAILRDGLRCGRNSAFYAASSSRAHENDLRARTLGGRTRVRVDVPRRLKSAGLLAGLSISRRIARLHN